MRRIDRPLLIGFALSGFLLPELGQAGEVEILDVTPTKTGNSWRFDVTLQHEDTGWDHYADAWELRDEAGNVLGTRTLFHPHVDEQPFTRSLTVDLPQDVRTIVVHAHDKLHGWSEETVTIELAESEIGE